MPSSPSTFFASLTDSQKKEVLSNVAQRAAARFSVYVEAAKRASNLPQLKGEEALQAYRSRTPEIWQALQTEFPREYQRHMQDWDRLERDAYNRLTRMYPMSGDRFVNLPSLSRADRQASNVYQAIPEPQI